MARLVRKDDKSRKAKQLIETAEYVLDAGNYYVLFRSKVKTKGEEFQFKISPEVQEKIRRRARQEGTTINQLLCQWVDEYEGLPDVSYYRRRNAKKEKLTEGVLMYMSKRTKEKVAQMAEKLGVSMSEVVRSIIEERLKS
ncbi:MAG: ribbon-helix-helix protein, CopG family [Nitrososphaerales archaeon]